MVEIPAERQMAKAVAMIVMIAMAMPRSGHQRACIITCPGNHKNDKDDEDDEDDENDENDENGEKFGI